MTKRWIVFYSHMKESRYLTSNLTVRPILVTGGAGFIGSHLIDRLLAGNSKVICLDNFYTGRLENISGFVHRSDFKLIEQDVINSFDLEVAKIYNLACPASLWRIRSDPVHCFKTSVYGAIHALDLAKKTGARLLQASSSEIYGDPERHPQEEHYWGNSNPVGERSCYDEGKRATETLCSDYHQQYGVDSRMARIFNTYGPRMQLNDGRVISDFIIHALKGEEIIIHGEGTQTRSFCYVDDLVDGLIKLMDYNGPYLGPVNLGNPEEHTMLELYEIIRELTGSKSQIKFEALRPDDPARRQPDIHLASKVLGFEPRVSLVEGLKRTIHYLENELARVDKKKD